MMKMIAAWSAFWGISLKSKLARQTYAISPVLQPSRHDPFDKQDHSRGWLVHAIAMIGQRMDSRFIWFTATNKFHTDVSENSGTPKSSILTGFSSINHPFWGTLIFGNTHTLIQDGTAYQWTSTIIHYCTWAHQPQTSRGRLQIMPSPCRWDERSGGPLGGILLYHISVP